VVGEEGRDFPMGRQLAMAKIDSRTRGLTWGSRRQ
jgi:hypothetical protein